MPDKPRLADRQTLGVFSRFMYGLIGGPGGERSKSLEMYGISLTFKMLSIPNM